MSAIPVYRIFVSSPGDVGREREMARKVCSRVEGRLGGRLKIEPYFWEEVPMLATRGDFQAQITEPAEFDLVICILWSRLGSRLHPGIHQRADGSAYASGTEYEFESAARAFKKSGRPDLLVYRRTETPLFPPKPREEMEARLAQYDALEQFCAHWFLDAGSFRAAFNQYEDLAQFEDKLESHLLQLARARLNADLPIAASSGGGAPTWTEGSPYRGLQVFDMEHEPIFFGRTKARDEVLGALRSRWLEERCPFVMIFGASGSGKSSLLRAGVLPWLIRPGVTEGVDRWRWLLFRPSDTPAGDDLLDGLTHALLSKEALPELGTDGSSARVLATMLRQSPEGAGLLLKGALSQAAADWQRRENLERQPVTRLAIGLDQLEEVFTAAERFSSESRTIFFRTIAALARSGFVWIVATLRSDFFNRCEEHAELVALKQNKGQRHLLPPSVAELSQMIRLPAEAAGVTFEEHAEDGRLEDVLRDEALTEPGALPLLEYALDELYRSGARQGTLTHADHARLGGVAGALARRAEETFGELPSSAQASLDEVLRQLVRLGEGAEESVARRTAAYTTVIAAPGAKELVAAFVAARLLVGDQSSGGERTITVAHESLLRNWPRALGWIHSNREFLRVRARIGASLALWQESGQHRDYLLSPGRPLAEAEELWALHRQTLDPIERDFIQGSSTAAREQLKSERRRLRSVITAISILLALSMLGGAFSLYQYSIAATQRATAIRRTEQAETARREANELNQFLLGGMRERLEEVGRLDLLNEAAAKAEEFLKRLDVEPDGGSLMDKERTETVALMRITLAYNVAQVRLGQGRLGEALAALEILDSLPSPVAQPSDAMRIARARLLNARCNILARTVDHLSAQKAGEAALSLLAPVADRPSEAILCADICVNLADLARQIRQPSEAQRQITRALRLCEPFTESLTFRTGRRTFLRALLRDIDLSLARGDLAYAINAAKRRLSLAEQFDKDEPFARLWTIERALGHDRLAQVYLRAEQLSLARQHAESSLKVWTTLLESDSDNREWLRLKATANTKLGQILLKQGNALDAAYQFDTAREISDRLVIAAPNNLEWAAGLATSLSLLGDASAQMNRKARAEGSAAPAQPGKWPEAEVYYQQALDIRRRLVEDASGSIDVENICNFVISLIKGAKDSMERLDYPRAETLAREALARARDLGGRRGAPPDHRVLLARAIEATAEILVGREEQPAGAELYKEAHALRRTMLSEFPTDPEIRFGFAECCLLLGGLYEDGSHLEVRQPNKDLAREQFRDSEKTMLSLVREFPEDSEYARLFSAIRRAMEQSDR